MEEQTQYRGASMVVIGGGVLLSAFDLLLGVSDGPPDVVALFGVFGFVTIVGGAIAYYRCRPR